MTIKKIYKKFDKTTITNRPTNNFTSLPNYQYSLSKVAQIGSPKFNHKNTNSINLAQYI